MVLAGAAADGGYGASPAVSVTAEFGGHLAVPTQALSAEESSLIQRVEQLCSEEAAHLALRGRFQSTAADCAAGHCIR